MDNSLEQFVQTIGEADTVEKYDSCVQKLLQWLMEMGYRQEIIQNTRIKGKYMINRFSDESTKENAARAKENLVFYLKSILSAEPEDSSSCMQDCLERYLGNFYSFLETFREIEPDKRASLTAEKLSKIQIENEYDLQHLLYAVLKPLFVDARREVAEDSGVGTVRSDIKIPSLHTIIEAKCTRKSMSLKALTEQIETDLVHYTAEHIYFYIYDKEKIIKDKQAFETYFNRTFDGKRVKIIVLQSVNI